MISNIEEFAADLALMCSRTPIAAGRPLTWTIIANPTAGGFTINSRWKRHREILRAYAQEAQKNEKRLESAGPSRTARETDGGNGKLGALGLVPTRYAGHAGEIVEALLDEAQASTDQLFHLIITAGGDGTSLEALTAFYAAPGTVRSQFAILRLPMGTGNDGADSRDLDTTLDLLVHPTRIQFDRAVRLRTSRADRGPFLAFNILSVGLDAFVTHMTNKMKGTLPGDSYKLWVDIATLFYDRIYRVTPMGIRVFNEAGEQIDSFDDTLLLLAFGASGNRTYGSNVRILPDGRNVCAVQQISLRKKIALKKLFLTGRHAELPEVRLFNAHRVELSYHSPLLAQRDGESVLLEEPDFPVSIELSEPAIPVLKRLP
jgi:diacylglycerol kinase family enzyme